LRARLAQAALRSVREGFDALTQSQRLEQRLLECLDSKSDLHRLSAAPT
jgi:hypothetical protein